MDAKRERQEFLESLLFQAITERNRQKIFELVEKGVSVKAKDVLDLSALHYAAQAGMPDVVKFFIEKGADVKEKHCDSKATPLHVACENYRDCITEDRQAEMNETIKILIEKGADVNAEDCEKRTPMHYAASSGSAKAVKRLLKAKADLNAVEKTGMTPLHAACASYDAEEKYLEDLLKNEDRERASLSLQSAILNSERRLERLAETIQTLIRHGARIDALDKSSLHPSDYLREKTPIRAYLENELRKRTNIIKFRKP